MATQYQRSVELEARVEAVTAELGVAREKLSVYEQRMEVVRSHVNDLSVRMGALKQLVAD